MAEQREKFVPLMNLPYVVTLKFDTPQSGSNERKDEKGAVKQEPWYRYTVEVEGQKTAEGEMYQASEEYSWFASKYPHGLIKETGIGKGGKLKVQITQGERNKHVWHITRADGKPNPEKAKPQESASKPAGTTSAPLSACNAQAGQATNHEESPTPPGQYDGLNGTGKRGWTREKIAEEVSFWIGHAIEEIAEQNEEEVGMPIEEICKFCNTGLIQSLRDAPPVDMQATVSSQISAIYDLLLDSLTLLGDESVVSVIEAWPTKYKAMLDTLPQTERDKLARIYKALSEQEAIPPASTRG